MKKQLVQWLKDAFAMEEGIAKMLEGHASDARKDGYIEAADKIQEHLEETESHAKRVEECLKSIGEDTSAGKSMFAKMQSSVQAVAGKMFDDEIIKAAISDHATEYFEIGAYEAIVAAANDCGEEKIAETCSEIIDEEEAMGEWLRSHLPDIVEEYLSRKEE